jgi:hypothetical protein
MSGVAEDCASWYVLSRFGSRSLLMFTTTVVCVLYATVCEQKSLERQRESKPCMLILSLRGYQVSVSRRTWILTNDLMDCAVLSSRRGVAEDSDFL